MGGLSGNTLWGPLRGRPKASCISGDRVGKAGAGDMELRRKESGHRGCTGAAMAESKSRTSAHSPCSRVMVIKASPETVVWG